jgi:hypothetical protein
MKKIFRFIFVKAAQVYFKDTIATDGLWKKLIIRPLYAIARALEYCEPLERR